MIAESGAQQSWADEANFKAGTRERANLPSAKLKIEYARLRQGYGGRDICKDWRLPRQLNNYHGEVAEWSNAVDSKSIVPFLGYRGFESLPLRRNKKTPIREFFCFCRRADPNPCRRHGVRRLVLRRRTIQIIAELGAQHSWANEANIKAGLRKQANLPSSH